MERDCKDDAPYTTTVRLIKLADPKEGERVMKIEVQGCLSCPLKSKLDDDDVWCNGTPGKRSLVLSFRQEYRPRFCPLSFGHVTIALTDTPKGGAGSAAHHIPEESSR